MPGKRDHEFLTDVFRELSQARVKFGDIRNDHEGYAVILEELDEFWQGRQDEGHLVRGVADRTGAGGGDGMPYGCGCRA